MDIRDKGFGAVFGPNALHYEDKASDKIVRPKGWPGVDVRRLGPQARLPAATSSAEAFDLDRLIIGSSAAAKALRDAVRIYAESDDPVLITGETGTGKELIAQGLHQLSARRDRPFVAVNAAGVHESIAGAELFGHAKGSFTGAHLDRDGVFVEADGGVLFLDEIGDAPEAVQLQLLRVLEDKMVRRIGAKSAARVDVRLVSATNIDLSHGESRREFRKDLFWRLNVIEIHAPPLHARGDDVIEIAEHFIAAHENPAFRSSRLSASAAARLRSHAFPGNFRELRNRIRRALLHARGGEIDGDMLGLDATQTAGTALTVDEAQALVAQFLVADALVKASGDPTAAGVLIGRAKSFVYAAMKAFDGEDPAAARRRLLAELKSRCS